MKQDLIQALKDKYTAQMSDAKAKMKIYLNNSVGVGEHPDVTGELDKMVQDFCEAKDKLETIRKVENEL